jgi:hypothetical protein
MILLPDKSASRVAQTRLVYTVKISRKVARNEGKRRESFPLAPVAAPLPVATALQLPSAATVAE